MAKSFYTAEEAAQRLGMTEEEVKGLVKAGKLREFRDAGRSTYRVDDVDAMAPADAAPTEIHDESASGEIVLEPADEDTDFDLDSAGSDILSLEEVDLSDVSDTSAGTRSEAQKQKEDSVVPSVGVNVFDDEDLDEAVDPLAQTAVTDVAGLGLEGGGSGSGILDLTRESDDTSLGAELLEEIYTEEDEGGAAEAEEEAVEMGDATRAGIDEAVTEEQEEVGEGTEDLVPVAEEEEAVGRPAVAVRQVVEYGPDALSTGLTALMIVGVVVMWFAGLAGMAMVRGIAPGMIRVIYANLWIYAVAALLGGVVAAGVTFSMAKRSG
ncbi:MAG: helix-turn-helix domain-containing protein [Phycisphaerales bacterium]|nr:MAG: helix-turn-helix domain-containing protein [Phycisphaerales bacterium]